MKLMVRTPAIVFILVCCMYSGICFAQTANLIGMANSQKKNMNRVSFVFDRTPEVEIDASGQRVRVYFINTAIADSFEKISENELFPPLMRVKTDEQGRDVFADLYFRDVPEFVDTSAGDGYGHLSVNVFWSRQGKRSRPAIHDQRLGRLRPIKDGSAAEMMIGSDYKGRWIEFFKEFEWSPDADLRINFSFPGLPCPLLEENRESFSESVAGLVESGLWRHVVRELEVLPQRNTEGKNADLHNFMLSACFLRLKELSRAEDVLKEVEPEYQNTPAAAWQAYMTAYSLAESGKIFQAIRIVDANRQAGLSTGGLAPWYAILEAELELAAGNNEQAIARLEQETAGSEKTRKIAGLRKADAHFRQGRQKEAFDLYSGLASDFALLQKYPSSLANWAMLLHRLGDYDRAYKYCFLLSETLGDKHPEKRHLADYWAAIARLSSGKTDLARLMLWEIDEKAAGSEAGFRAWLKLIDLDILEAEAPDFKNLVHDYRLISEEAATRQVREEAFFKQILAYHLAGKNFSAVKFLGRFFDDYWAGALQPEARALFVEIFPGVVDGLTEQGKFFEALTLVTKHRDLLAQAGITYGFLHNLAESYEKAGFSEQAAETYLYILDFEEDDRHAQSVYLPLVRIYHEMDNFGRVKRYATEYLNSYPEGQDRTGVLYFYADALARKGETDEALVLLHENKRPRTARLDYLTGSLFFEQKRWEQAWNYLSRAAEAGFETEENKMNFKRAEAGFHLGKWEKVAPVYRDLLDVPEYRGQAGYRLVEAYSNLGEKSRALNIYRELAEMEIEDRWLELASQTAETENRINRGQ